MTDINIDLDIEKVISQDYTKLSEQLKYIFQTEQDIVNFINFLKNLQKFISLSNDKRHTTLMELCYFKSQINLYEKKISSLLEKRKNIQLKASYKKAKMCGEKITENVLAYYLEEDSTITTLEDLLNIVTTWYNYMQDLYYMCSQTNKNIGGIY